MEYQLDQMNIHQLLVNPTGPHSAYMTSRARIIDDLNSRYEKLIQTNKTFTFKIYKKKEDYYFVFKIPSEKYSQLFYDVVIQFIGDEETIKERTIRNYKLRLFSNSPAFTFTYAYVLNKNNVLVEILKSKFSKEALNNPPSVKNPVESYGFEKSCYFACRFIQQNDLLGKFDLDNNKYVYSETNIKRGISTDIAKLKEYNLVKSANKKKGSKDNKIVKTEKPSGMTTVNKFKRKEVKKSKVKKPINSKKSLSSKVKKK